MKSRICAICGNEFTPIKPIQKYCTRRCASLYKAKRDKERRKAETLYCIVCGNVVDRENSCYRRYCSERCARKFAYDKRKEKGKLQRFLYAKPAGKGREKHCFFCPFSGWKCRSEMIFPCSGYSPLHEEYKRAVAEMMDENYIK